MTMFGVHPLDTMIRSADEVAAIPGTTAPKAWPALRQRYEESLAADDGAAAQMYAAAVVAGGKDLPQLRVNALAGVGASSAHAAELNHHVQAAVYLAAVEMWKPVAQANLEVIAALFDTAADELAAAIELVPLGTDIQAVITADTARREAFAAHVTMAATLDALAPKLEAAAEMTGATLFTTEYRLPLFVDTTRAHRRHTWEAFDYPDDGRAGKWGQLTVAAKVRANRNPSSIEPYARPEPVREERRQSPDGRGFIRVTVDPADIEFQGLVTA